MLSNKIIVNIVPTVKSMFNDKIIQICLVFLVLIAFKLNNNHSYKLNSAQNRF